MSAFDCLHDRSEISSYLESEPYLHIYGLGDLDEFFWPVTMWYGLRSRGAAGEGRLQAVVLVYAGPRVPTVLGLTTDPEPMRELINEIRYLLPVRFFAHLSADLERELDHTHQIEFAAPHLKMGLISSDRIKAVETAGASRLARRDQEDLEDLYEVAYPGNWFDPRMLETNQFFGVHRNDKLIAAAGVHVYSPRYRVAALGNVVTHPDFRKQGYGTTVTAAVCKSLLEENLRIGLNVKEDNAAAVNAYRKLGFEVIGHYGEFLIRCKKAPG